MTPRYTLDWIEPESQGVYRFIEDLGLSVDCPLVKDLIDDTRFALANAQTNVESLTGLRIKPHRAQDVEAVAGAMGIDLPRTFTGRPRTDRNTLTAYPELEPVIRLKELSHNLSTAQGVHRRVINGRLWPHYVFHPELARPHVSQVNYMNWPEWLRPILTAEIGHRFVIADFQGMELRVLAALSDDRELAKALDQEDFHRTTAARVFNQSTGQITDEQRQTAKTLTFAVLYGSTAAGLAYKLRIDPHQAQLFIDQWRAAYPEAMQFVRQIQREGVRLGYVETYHGRHRDIRALVRQDIGKARRLAINHVIQSTAGDLMRIGLINLWPRVQELGGRVLGTVHDSYLISVPETLPVADLLKVIREGAIELNEPLFKLRMKVAIGTRWGSTPRSIDCEDVG